MSVTDFECSNRIIFGNFQLFPFIIGLIELMLMFVLVMVFRYRSFVSSWYSGESGVKEGVTFILPIYFNVYYFSVIEGILVGINCLLGYDFAVYIQQIRWIVIRSFCDGLAIFLIHNGIGQRALKNSLTIGLLWATFSGSLPLIIYYVIPNNQYNSYLISVIVFTVLLMVFYLCYGTVPMNLLHRRPALIRYSFANFFLLSLSLVENILLLNNFSKESCIVEFFGLISDCIQPLILLIAIRRDSMFWQGLYQNNGMNSLNQPMMGVWEMGRDTIKYVADTINQLERLVVPIIPFTQLKVDNSKYFSGGTARVYRGKFGLKDVAIKFLFSIELTPEAVINFCEEATMLNSLQHPNVVKCYGVAVMPPALCLVTEFCEYGSLYDFLHTTDIIVRESNSTLSNIPNRNHLGSNDSSRISSITKSSMNENGSTRHSLTNDRFSQVNNPMSREYSNESKNPILENSFSNDSKNDSILENAPSTLAEATLTSPNNNYLITVLSNQNSISVNSSQRNADSGTGSTLFSGSTLENKDFSIKLVDLSTGNKDESSNPSNIKKSFLSFASTKNKLKTADVIMRSTNYGLGPQEIKSKKQMRLLSKSQLSSNNMGELLVSTNNNQTNISVDRYRQSIIDNSLNSSRHSDIAGRSLPFAIRIRMARDAAAGVAYMHANKLMHCDIKSLNFLVTRDLKVKLADVGEARSTELSEAELGKLPININWSSPEVLHGNAGVNQSADIWSLAVVLSEIFTGNVPFDTKEIRLMPYEEFSRQLENGLRPDLSSPILKDHSYIKDLINDAWKYHPKDRINALEIVIRLESYYLSKFNKPLVSVSSNLSM